MTTPVTEVINESDFEIVLKEGNAGHYMLLSTLEGNGDRFVIKCGTANATYREYYVGRKHVGGDTAKFVISSDDCAECERILIRNGRETLEDLELEKIARGASVTELVNDTDRRFNLKYGGADFLVLKKQEKTYILPKLDGTDLEYSLEELLEGDHHPIPIPIQDLADNQRITISEGEGNVGVQLIRVPRGLYLTEVVNKTSTEFKVKRRYGSRASNSDDELATLQKNQKYTIEYNPATKGREYWVESSPTQKLYIKPTDFLNSQRMNIIYDRSSRSNALQSVSRVARDTSKRSLWSRFWEAVGF